jgi:two-component system response regulator AtoC
LKVDTKILIVDDNSSFCRSLEENLRRHDYQSTSVGDTQSALRAFLSSEYPVVLLDVMLGSESGIDLLRRLRELRKGVSVIMITGHATIESAVEAIKIGAFDYIQKPVKFEKLLRIVQNANQMASLSSENRMLKERLSDFCPQVVTRTPEMLRLLETAGRLAQTDLPVLIVGENGTGKEIIADFIHFNSPRANEKMYKINCASFPESLLDNELFGHEKGAYTGATAVHRGVFETASRGTLFLDEIADMGLEIQSKILRALQNHEVRRLGGNDIITVDTRFITATNRSLEGLIAERKFREDLFYRLNTATLTVMPLQDRRDDIPLLTDYFVEEYRAATGKAIAGVGDEVRTIFLEHNWPGNVRELKNAVSYACAVTSDERIDIEDLPTRYRKGDEGSRSFSVLNESERSILQRAMREAGFNKKKAASLLKIGRSTLYSKLRKYDLLG